MAGTIGRRVKRGTRQLSRSIARGESLATAVGGFVSPGRTRAEEIAEVSRRENQKYRRYVTFAMQHAAMTIRREAADVRMNPEHKWGVGPYHYRDSDYLEIAADVRVLLEETREDD